MISHAPKVIAAMVLPLVIAFGGCASNNPNINGVIPHEKTRISPSTTQTPQKLLKDAFNITVNEFRKMGFGNETGIGPDNHRNLCPVVFSNGYKPCAKIEDPSVAAIVPYGPNSKNGIDGLIFQDTIASVNKTVNEAIIPTSDAKKYRGFLENWSFPRPPGSAETGYVPDIDNLKPKSLEDDCDGYVLLKQYILLQKKIASHPAYVKTKKGEGHLVLVVLTDQGPIVLDNVTKEPTLWINTIYAKKGHTLQILNGWDPSIYGWHSMLPS